MGSNRILGEKAYGSFILDVRKFTNFQSFGGFSETSAICFLLIELRHTAENT